MRHLAPMVEFFFDSGAKAVASKNPLELHAFRITAKRLRYSLEILEPKGADELISKLRDVQNRLGTMHDALVAEQFLRELKTLSTRARPLPSKLVAEAHSHIDAFCRAWPKQFSQQAQNEWIAWARALPE